ncbi:hypothetical protein VW29_08825 [Devosia limi DSM 17137]|uniref:Uncharacterized protein n=1 Tax=Devosia limi DSM 17137 TaxID=1121477 RepID=A0A0F5LTC0_9HYPH|nr:hypothetical protein [Devosia limi]KKB84917.1 hypothetical protein VW29_08825 [Devosia limi DSM 17137]SHF05661.1 hypothetical protein SAMN02745223_01697 [Devosia limi DSM 17137]
MKRGVLAVGTLLTLALSGAAQAGEAGDLLRDHLYAGTLAEGLAAVAPLAEAGDAEASFAAGFLTFAGAAEGLAQDFYRHGATTPAMPAAVLLFGGGADQDARPANPNPERLTYQGLRTIFAEFLTDLDAARTLLEAGGEGGDYVVPLDPLQFRMDIDGDGVASEAESLGSMLRPLLDMVDIPLEAEPLPGHKTKGPPAQLDTTIGFDRADALWMAGYSQVLAAQVDFVLAHDFEQFFNVYLHRVFPKAGLPMQDFVAGGTQILDADGDAGIADMIAGIHQLDFPVIDSDRLAGVLKRLQAITSFSRRNWGAILLETDDYRELVPSPTQTSLFPEAAVTEETVTAWMETLDSVDRILEGQLLIPHGRFKQGFDLKAYFETATETDLVLILTGYGALPFLKDGPIADAESFAAANRVFGDNLLGYAFWFN